MEAIAHRGEHFSAEEMELLPYKVKVHQQIICRTEVSPPAIEEMLAFKSGKVIVCQKLTTFHRSASILLQLYGPAAFQHLASGAQLEQQRSRETFVLWKTVNRLLLKNLIILNTICTPSIL